MKSETQGDKRDWASVSKDLMERLRVIKWRSDRDTDAVCFSAVGYVVIYSD